MVTGLYAIKDELSDNLLGIMEYNSRGEAERFFELMVNESSNTLLYNCPGDFSLWKIGEIDKKEGKITSTETEKLINGRSIWKGDKKNNEI